MTKMLGIKTRIPLGYGARLDIEWWSIKKSKTLNIIKIENFCSVKRMKRQTTEWAKIYSNQCLIKD